MAVENAEGVTHTYFFKATSLRHAKRHAREWVSRTEWSATLVEVAPADGRGWESRRRRRLVAVAGVTFAVSGLTLTAVMILDSSVAPIY
jgi:hypothetical protein